MNWLALLGYTAKGGFSYLWSTFSTNIGFSIAAILAVFKTDTNIFLKLFILLMMYSIMLATFTYICKLVLSAYVQIGTAIAHQNNYLLARIVSLVPLTILSYLFIPVIKILLRLICVFPVFILYVSGHRQDADYFLDLVANRNRNAIGY